MPRLSKTPKQQYLPAAELWRRAIDQLVAANTISAAQAESWLRPCQLSTLDLPSGETTAATLKTRTSYAAEHVRHTYAALIRYTLQRLTNKHVVLFVRGPNDSPWIGPPDGYPFEAA
jgi:hypothetical protein